MRSYSNYLIIPAVALLILAGAANIAADKPDAPPATVEITDSGYIQADECRLYYEIAGEGPNMVMLHDGLLHSELPRNLL